MKKKILAICTALALVVSLFAGAPGKAMAAEPVVSNLTASATTSAITVSGTVSSDIAAVMVEVLHGATSLAKISFAVQLDNTFTGTVGNLTLTAGQTYTVRAADYTGGAWKTTTCTVPGGSGSGGGTINSGGSVSGDDSGSTGGSGSNEGSTAAVTPVPAADTGKNTDIVDPDKDAVAPPEIEKDGSVTAEIGVIGDKSVEIPFNVDPNQKDSQEMLNSLLKDKDLENVKSGKTLDIKLEAKTTELDEEEKKDISNAVTALQDAFKNGLESGKDFPTFDFSSAKDSLAKLSERTPENAELTFSVGTAYDFSLTKKIGDSDAEEIHSLNGKDITLTFTLSKEDIQTNPSLSRVYYLAHLKNTVDKAIKGELLETQYDQKSGKLTFSSKDLSPFVLLYVDVARYSEVGDKLTSAARNAKYTVIKSGDVAGTVGELQYDGPIYTKMCHTIVSKVKIDGIQYKVSSIADSAFAKNDKVVRVKIGKYVQSIDSKAFYHCDNLTSVVFLGTKLKTVGSKAFNKTSKDLTIEVPKKKLKAYRNLMSSKNVIAAE